MNKPITDTSKPTKGVVDVNQLEAIIRDHNKAMRTDMASEIAGGNRSAAITDVITVKALLHWHKKELASLLAELPEKRDVEEPDFDMPTDPEVSADQAYNYAIAQTAEAIKKKMEGLE